MQRRRGRLSWEHELICSSLQQTTKGFDEEKFFSSVSATAVLARCFTSLTPAQRRTKGLCGVALEMEVKVALRLVGCGSSS